MLFYPCEDVIRKSSFYLWSKVFNVGLFFLQGSLRDEHGEVAVLHTQFLNLKVKEVFNGFPDGERPGPQDIAAADIIILNHLCFSDDLGEEGQHYNEMFVFFLKKKNGILEVEERFG